MSGFVPVVIDRCMDGERPADSVAVQHIEPQRDIGGGFTPAQRIDYTLAAFDWAQRADWVAMLAMWAFRYPQATRSYQDNWTFVTEDFQPKPIYDEVQKALTHAK